MAQGSFHGTAISVFQFPNDTLPGISRPKIALLSEDQGKYFTLPDNYSVVPAVNFKTSEVNVNITLSDSWEIKGDMAGAVQQENSWINHSLKLLISDLISWAGYHSSFIESVKDKPIISSLFAMFNETAASVSMVKHGMDVLRQTTSSLMQDKYQF